MFIHGLTAGLIFGILIGVVVVRLARKAAAPIRSIERPIEWWVAVERPPEWWIAKAAGGAAASTDKTEGD